MDITIITNNHPRDLLQWHELTDREKSEFSYTNGDDSTDYRFVRYRGECYDIHDTEGPPSFAPGWDMYISDTFFSGVLFKWLSPKLSVDEQVIVGRYYT